MDRLLVIWNELNTYTLNLRQDVSECLVFGECHGPFT